MDVRQLRYFVHVAEFGSFSKASAFLSVAQSALSRQVRKLESELGTPVLYRNGRGVAVTEAGGHLLTRAKVILSQVDRARVEITALKGEPTGSATLGVTPTVSHVLITPLIKRFRTHYPRISLQVIEGFSGHVYEWLAGGRLDVALLYNAPNTRKLASEQLLVEELFFIGPKIDYGGQGPNIAFAELADRPLILPSRPHGLRMLVDTAAAEAGVPLRIEFELDAFSAIKELVEDGAANTILPFAAVHGEVAAGRIAARRIVEPTVSRALLMASSTQRPLTLAARALLGQVKVVVHELVEGGQWLGTA